MYKIYLLKDSNDLEYIGKTKQSLKQRLNQHRNDRNRGHYCSSQKLNLDNCDMILLEGCEKDIASEREQYWMEQYPNRVNQKNAILDIKKRKEYDKQYQKQWYIDNKEKVKEYDKNQYINKQVKECIDDIIDQVILMS